MTKEEDLRKILIKSPLGRTPAGRKLLESPVPTPPKEEVKAPVPAPSPAPTTTARATPTIPSPIERLRDSPFGEMPVVRKVIERATTPAPPPTPTPSPTPPVVTTPKPVTDIGDVLLATPLGRKLVEERVLKVTPIDKKIVVTPKKKIVTKPIVAAPGVRPARVTVPTPVAEKIIEEPMKPTMVARPSIPAKIPVSNTSKSNAEIIAQRYRNQGYTATVVADGKRYKVVLGEGIAGISPIPTPEDRRRKRLIEETKDEPVPETVVEAVTEKAMKTYAPSKSKLRTDVLQSLKDAGYTTENFRYFRDKGIEIDGEMIGASPPGVGWTYGDFVDAVANYQYDEIRESLTDEIRTDQKIIRHGDLSKLDVGDETLWLLKNADPIRASKLETELRKEMLNPTTEQAGLKTAFEGAYDSLSPTEQAKYNLKFYFPTLKVTTENIGEIKYIPGGSEYLSSYVDPEKYGFVTEEERRKLIDMYKKSPEFKEMKTTHAYRDAYYDYVAEGFAKHNEARLKVYPRWLYDKEERKKHGKPEYTAEEKIWADLTDAQIKQYATDRRIWDILTEKKYKEKWWGKKQFVDQATHSFFKATAKSTLAILTFPEFIAEEVGGRLWLGRPADILPFREVVAEAFQKHDIGAPPGLIEGGITQAIVGATQVREDAPTYEEYMKPYKKKYETDYARWKERRDTALKEGKTLFESPPMSYDRHLEYQLEYGVKSEPWERMEKYPIQAGIATFGEIIGFYGGAKALGAVKHYGYTIPVKHVVSPVIKGFKVPSFISKAEIGIKPFVRKFPKVTEKFKEFKISPKLEKALVRIKETPVMKEVTKGVKKWVITEPAVPLELRLLKLKPSYLLQRAYQKVTAAKRVPVEKYHPPEILAGEEMMALEPRGVEAMIREFERARVPGLGIRVTHATAVPLAKMKRIIVEVKDILVQRVKRPLTTVYNKFSKLEKGIVGSAKKQDMILTGSRAMKLQSKSSLERTLRKVADWDFLVEGSFKKTENTVKKFVETLSKQTGKKYSWFKLDHPGTWRIIDTKTKKAIADITSSKSKQIGQITAGTKVPTITVGGMKVADLGYLLERKAGMAELGKQLEKTLKDIKIMTGATKKELMQFEPQFYGAVLRKEPGLGLTYARDTFIDVGERFGPGGVQIPGLHVTPAHKTAIWPLRLMPPKEIYRRTFLPKIRRPSIIETVVEKVERVPEYARYDIGKWARYVAESKPKKPMAFITYKAEIGGTELESLIPSGFGMISKPKGFIPYMGKIRPATALERFVESTRRAWKKYGDVWADIKGYREYEVLWGKPIPIRKFELKVPKTVTTLAGKVITKEKIVTPEKIARYSKAMEEYYRGITDKPLVSIPSIAKAASIAEYYRKIYKPYKPIYPTYEYERYEPERPIYRPAYEPYKPYGEYEPGRPYDPYYKALLYEPREPYEVARPYEPHEPPYEPYYYPYRQPFKPEVPQKFLPKPPKIKRRKYEKKPEKPKLIGYKELEYKIPFVWEMPKKLLKTKEELPFKEIKPEQTAFGEFKPKQPKKSKEPDAFIRF